MLNPYRVSLTLLLSFCEGSHTLAEMACLVFHFICGIPPRGFIPITCTDSLSLMVLAWKDLRVSLFR
jgi:hypothetical protein